MTKRFFYSCLFALLTLLCSVADGSAQSDTTKFLQDTLRLGNILPGTTLRDTVYLRLAGQPRDVTFTSSDTALKITSQNPYPFKSSITLPVILQVIPWHPGTDTVYLAAIDTSKKDTLVVIFSSIAQSDFRFNPDTVKIGQLIVGAPLTEDFYIVSRSNALKIDKLSTSDTTRDSLSLFGFQLPFTVSAGDSVRISFRLIPKETGSRAIRLTFQDSTGVSRTQVILVEGILPTSTDTIFSNTQTNTIARVTEEDEFTMFLRLRNDEADTIDIQDFILEDTANFGIEDFPILPLVIPPDSSTPPIEVYAKKTGPGLFRTNVIVPTVGGLASEYTVGVQVLKIMQGSVAPIRSSSGVIVYQSSTEIAIEGLPFETGRLEIYDLLGRKIVVHPITASEIFISKLDASGARIEDGCYVMRLADARGRYSESIKVLLVSY